MDALRPVAGTPGEVVGALRAWLAAPEDTPEARPIIVETSGSTGRPKGVVLSRGAVLASVAATADRLGGSGQWLLALPPTYVAGVMVICRSLVAGHEPVLLEDRPFAIGAVVAGLHGPAYTSLVPTQLHRLLDERVSVGALRTFAAVLVGGGHVEPALRARAESEDVRLVRTYGSAETAGGCVYDGRPLSGVRVQTEADGRLRIAGPMLFEGYDGDPGLTAESLVDGWFRTSDRGTVTPDGQVRVSGRLDDMVVSGGLNVPLPAVAARLREHPAVAAAEVLGVPDPEWGHRIVAFVVGNVDDDRALAWARDWVSAVHPRAWAPRQVVVLRELPLLPNGKADRERLRALA